MKGKAREGKGADTLRLELKYCERCGGLWLRPVGGEQIYCVACARGMAELPPASHEAEAERVPRGAQWGVHADDRDGYGEDEGEDLGATGGVV